MTFQMMPHRMFRVLGCVCLMTVRKVSVVSGLVVVARVMMFCSL